MLKIKTFVFNPFQLNTYILYNEHGQGVIIDAGNSNENENNQLVEFLTNNNITPVRLLNTHCHIDHIMGNKFIKDKYHLIPEAHELEQENITSSDSHAMLYGLEKFEPPAIGHFLHEGDTIVLNEDILKVIHVPGHTPGHLAFYCESQNFVISGDVLFERSIGRTDLPGGDFDTLIDSIFNKLFVLGDDVTVYSGHGNPTTIGDEKRLNPFISDYL